MTPLNHLTNPDHPAVVIARRPRPGHEKAFEAWAGGIYQVMANQPGFRSYQAIPPAEEGQKDWFFLFTFEDAETLRTWLHSDTRAQWQALSESMTEGPGHTRVVHGLESLMGIPPGEGDTPAWKVAALTELGLAPVVFVWALALVQVPFYNRLTPWWQTVLSTTLCVSTMTWVVMPILMRLFRKWMYPTPKAPEAP